MARKSKGRLFRRGKSETWFLEYFVNGKKIREALRDPVTKEPITDKVQAEKMRRQIIEPMRVQDQAAKLRALVARAEQADDDAAAAADITTDQAWALFDGTELLDAAPSSAKDYRQNWAKFQGFWGSKGLRAFAAVDAKDFAKQLTGEKLSGNRFNKILNLCDRVFKSALGVKPFQVIKRRQVQQVGRRELTEAEIMAVIDAAPDHHPTCGVELRVLLMVGIYTGLRLIDAALLNEGEVDVSTRRLQVTPRKTRRKGKHLVIPIHPALMVELAKCVPNDDGDLLPEIARKYRLQPSMITRLVGDLLESQGITTQLDVGTAHKRAVAGFHSLRHSFVTICSANGVPLPVVQELAGHGSPAIQKRYMHMGVKETQAAIEALPNFGEPVVRVPDLCFSRSVEVITKGKK